MLQCGESDVGKVNLGVLWPIRAAEMELINYFLWDFTPINSFYYGCQWRHLLLPVFHPIFHVASPSMSSVWYIPNVTISSSYLGAILCSEDDVYLMWHFSYLLCLDVQIADSSVLSIFFLSIINILSTKLIVLDFCKKKKNCVLDSHFSCSKFWHFFWNDSS